MNRINRINLDSLPPYYQKACEKLRQDLTNSTTIDAKLERCRTFLDSYFMIPPLWYDFLQLLKETEAMPYEMEAYSNQALKQFYSEDLYQYLVLDSKPFTKTIEAYQYMNVKTKYMRKTQLEDGLSYPHEHLDNLYHHYIQLTGNPMPQNVYKDYLRSKKVYNKLCEVYDNEAKWIKVLASTKDDDFIKQNIEARIGREYVNKKLWRLYIKYLDATKDMWILSVYCRYCNFFIEDLGMREKYFDKIEYYAKLEEPVSKFWIDVIAFTLNHGSKEDIKEMILKALAAACVDFSPLHMFLEYDLEEVLPKPLHKELRTEIHKTYDRVVGNRNKKWSNLFPTTFLCEKSYVNMGESKRILKFDQKLFGWYHPRFRNEHRGAETAPVTVQSSKPKAQYFSLPAPIMRYIMLNAPMSVLIKLFKTCKYFFYRQKLVPVHSIKIQPFQPPPKSYTNQLSLTCSADHQAFQRLNSLWINGLFSSCSEEATRQLLLKTNIFEPCIIQLQNQAIPMTTFTQLMESGTCKVLKLTATTFTHADGRSATLEDILQASPSVTDYSFRCQFLVSDIQQLPKITRKNKFQRFTLKFVHDQLDIPSFLQFLKKNAAPLCKIKICYDQAATPPYRNQMKLALENFKHEMPKYCGKPWIIYMIRAF